MSDEQKPPAVEEPVEQTKIEARREMAVGTAKRFISVMAKRSKHVVADDPMCLRDGSAEAQLSAAVEANVVEEELTEAIEQLLIMGEKRGIAEAKTFISQYVGFLRGKHADGVANHVQECLMKFHTWTNSSADFVTKKQFDELVASGAIVQRNAFTDGKGETPTKIVQPNGAQVRSILEHQEARKFFGQKKNGV